MKKYEKATLKSKTHLKSIKLNTQLTIMRFLIPLMTRGKLSAKYVTETMMTSTIF